MATVMTSHRSGGAPPLPSRSPAQTGTFVKRNHSQPIANQVPREHPGRSQSVDAPPPVPPVSNNRRPSEPLGGVANRGDRLPPPLPRRASSDTGDQPPRIVRKKYETDSFIDRHTAKAYSNHGGKDSQTDSRYPPPPQATRALPRHRMRDVYDAEQCPDRRNVYPSTNTNDLEKRFTFHDMSDFPEPEPREREKKTYPSLSQSIRMEGPPTSASKPVDRLGYL